MNVQHKVIIYFQIIQHVFGIVKHQVHLVQNLLDVKIILMTQYHKLKYNVV